MLKGISDEKAAWQHLAPLSHQLCSGLLMLAISCLDCYLKKEKTKCLLPKKEKTISRMLILLSKWQTTKLLKKQTWGESTAVS